MALSSALSILPCRTPNTSCRGFAHGRAWKSLRPAAAAAGCRPSSVLVVAATADSSSSSSSSSSAGVVTSPGVADRPLWLPGSTPPAHLDGRLVGDFGFDPLGLGQDPAALRWYVQAELIHARFAMAGVTGILFTDILRVTGLKDVPVWYEAGAYHFDFADTKTLFCVQLLLMGFVETKRWLDFVTPGSQAAEDSFFGWEAAFEGLECGYPGGPLFDPMGLASDVSKSQPLKLKELKNGRLAMVAWVGLEAQAYVTGTGPIDNLLTHLSDPAHRTIVQVLAEHRFL
ncbi:unnamed protein product [Sphagnum balticum]